jgi:general stress protein 26
MPADGQAPDQIQTRLWDTIEKHPIGMLGLAGAQEAALQPMTAFAERETGRLWFFTYKDTDLAEAVGGGAAAMFVYQRDDLQACLTGRLRLQPDRERMDRYWNPVVAAWYPQGKDDPRLTMLCFDAEAAQVWTTDAGPTRFAWEIAKANATHHRPDLGGRASLDLH